MPGGGVVLRSELSFYGPGAPGRESTAKEGAPVGDFVKSTRFKILLGVLIVLFAFLLRASYTGGMAPMVSQVLGFITTPLQRVSSEISNSVTGVFRKYLQADQITEENEQLKEKIRILNQQLVDYEKYKQENEQLREYLEIKEDHPDFTFEYASVIGRDSTDRFYSFTIDKGSLAGIEVRDPVITADGLVGIVNEVGLTYSKVLTILDVALEIGAYDVRTRDIGMVTGKIGLSGDGRCQMNMLPKDSGAAPGDLVYTSGFGGLYPQDIAIGEILEIETESHGMSLYAVIQPSADIQNVKDVQVIKDFQGQGEQVAE